LNKDARTANAKFDHRFRIQPVFKIHDRLTLNTKFEGLDRANWGESEGDIAGSTKNFDLERAWVDAEFDMFTLTFGRMVAGTCGLLYCNADSDADRIKVILKGIDPFYLDFTYTKYDEQDWNTTNADSDEDGYAVMGSYKTENIEGGLLLEYVKDSTNSDGANPYSSSYMVIDPFFKGVFGMVTVEAEMQWATGDYADYDGATPDVDYDAMRYVLDVGFDFGMITAGIGYAHADGRGYNEQDYTNAGFGGNDWEPLMIMTGFDTYDAAGTGLLGGVGNFNGVAAGNAPPATRAGAAGPATTWGDAGMDIFYLYGSYPVMENLTLNAIIGTAKADETSRFNTVSAPDDAIGWEFDIGVKWQIMDNMTYDAKFGYFSPDDFWKFGVAGARDPDETYSVMHSVVVTF
jgi:hypothetical protein